MPEDVIKDAEQFSWIDRQQFLFLKNLRHLKKQSAQPPQTTKGTPIATA